MASLQKHIEQPLLTSQQVQVCHELYRADQLCQALKVAKNLIENIRDESGFVTKIPTRREFNVIELYLQCEISKCLNNIRQLKQVSNHSRAKSNVTPIAKLIVPPIT